MGERRYCVAKHFLECCTSEGKFDNLKIKLTESVNIIDDLLGKKL